MIHADLSELQRHLHWNRATGCVEVQGPLLNTGYPYVVDEAKSSSAVYTARRFVVAEFLNTTNDDLEGNVRSVCGNKLCVRVGHMIHPELVPPGYRNRQLQEV